MNELIGREREEERLKGYYKSGCPEFVAVYGRRRVGKTFLIDSCFNDKYDFYASGVIGGKMKDELSNFNRALKEYGGDDAPVARNWEEAFIALRRILEPKLSKKRVVVFLDELPCFDTPRSGFINAIDNFWNTWASKQKNMMLIVCGSATSWMVEKIIDSHGGLHNRITHEMHLKPFNLAQTETFLNKQGFHWSKLNIAQCYMVFGGIPYYLTLLEKNMSLPQNIDALFFSQHGELRREYQRLFYSLFRKPEKYMEIVECLAKSRNGLSRKDLIKRLSIKSGDKITQVLRNLEYCDFIRSYSINGNPLSNNGRCYQLVDFFAMFFLKFCTKPTSDNSYWVHNVDKPIVSDWYGIMFEILCVNHIDQIKRALGIGGLYTEYAGWRSKNEVKVQIDLLIDRADDLIDLCEMKYTRGVYELTKAEADKLERRRDVFESETNTRKGVRFVLVTPTGLKQNKYYHFFNNIVTLEDLFKKD